MRSYRQPFMGWLFCWSASGGYAPMGLAVRAVARKSLEGLALLGRHRKVGQR